MTSHYHLGTSRICEAECESCHLAEFEVVLPYFRFSSRWRIRNRRLLPNNPVRCHHPKREKKEILFLVKKDFCFKKKKKFTALHFAKKIKKVFLFWIFYKAWYIKDVNCGGKSINWKRKMFFISLFILSKKIFSVYLDVKTCITIFLIYGSLHNGRKSQQKQQNSNQFYFTCS